MRCKVTQKQSNPTYSFDACSQCKSICCKDAKPPLTNKRQKILNSYLKKQRINIQEPFTTKNYTYPAVDEQLYCRFFNKETGKCIVHSVKPETCVAGPITFDIDFCTKKIGWFLKTNELCTYAEVLFKNKIAFEAHFEIAKKQVMQLIYALSINELRELMKIEEPQTFKFSEETLPLELVKKFSL